MKNLLKHVLTGDMLYKIRREPTRQEIMAQCVDLSARTAQKDAEIAELKVALAGERAGKPVEKSLQPTRTFDFDTDGVAVWGKNLSFLDDAKFVEAWSKASALNVEAWHGSVPDVRWRAHVACWAAQQALHLEGDFVECGVHGGLFSLTVCDFVDFNTTGRRFWLFDTFEGIPMRDIEEREREHVDFINKAIYFRSVYDIAKRNFADVPNAVLVRGMLPESLTKAQIDKIAYMSIDLNNVAGERGAIEALWDKIVPGGIIVLDDYAFAGYDPQHEFWNGFARAHNRIVLTVPTGQGILIK